MIKSIGILLSGAELARRATTSEAKSAVQYL
jgi:hypothetical protein